MTTLHLIQGGTRVGDTFHIAARLNQIGCVENDKYYDVTAPETAGIFKQYNKVIWHHSEHEAPVARFLQKYSFPWLKLQQHNIKRCALPMDVRCVHFFRNELVQSKEFWDQTYDGNQEIEDRFHQFLVDSPENPYKDCSLRFVEPLPELNEGFLPYKKGEYIALQFDSRSDWKRIPILTQVNFPLPVVSVGWPKECAWGHNCHSVHWHITGKVIQDSACFVGINSACSVFAWYINHPQVVCHYERLNPGEEPLGSRYFIRKKTCRVVSRRYAEDNKTLGGRIMQAVEEVMG